jgi:hypothetical protein
VTRDCTYRWATWAAALREGLDTLDVDQAVLFPESATEIAAGRPSSAQQGLAVPVQEALRTDAQGSSTETSTRP